MTEHERSLRTKLDEVLKAYNKADYAHGKSAVDIKKINKLKHLSDTEISLLALKLETDGRITWTPHKHQVRDLGGWMPGEVSTQKIYFHRNVDGMLFAEEGGYIKQAHREARENRKKVAIDVALLLAGVYAVFQIGEAAWKVIRALFSGC